ncbi:MAG: winged helix-turn-helix domain-containing protein [Planctomycetota bacterium]
MARPKKEMNNKSACQEFEMDLTDYVTGDPTFLTKDRQTKLFEHLRTCADCRAQLWNWKEVLAVMKGKAESQKPEYKAKMDKLIQELQANSAKPTCQTGQGRQLIDVKSEVGDLSGLLWKILAKHGELPEAELHKHLNTTVEMAHQALGWLERENKVLKIKDAKGVLVCLTETERLQYRPQA